MIAPSGNRRAVVGGPQNIEVLVQIVHNLPFAPGVVAQGDDVGSGIQDILRLVRGDAHYGGIFAIDDDEIGTCFPFQLPQVAADPVHTGVAYHIAYAKHLQFHCIFLHANIFSII